VRAPAACPERPARSRRWLADLRELLAIPSISGERRHLADVGAAADWLVHHLRSIGLADARTVAGRPGGSPHVLASWLAAPGRPTVLLHGHFDVQAPGPQSSWSSHPFVPTLRGERLYARGASDDKGQLFAAVTALGELLARDGRLPLNVRVWFEGEEEIGSPGVDAFVERERASIRADAALVADTQMLEEGRPTIVTGLRGLVSADVVVSGPRRDVHSGLFGGAVANPAEALATIVAALHDPAGRVDLPGFYRTVRSAPTSRRAEDDPTVLSAAGVDVSWGEPGWTADERRSIRPALIVTTIAAGGRQPRAAIPARAIARVTLRLVPDQDPLAMASALVARVREVAPPAVRVRVVTRAAVPPVVVRCDHPAVMAAAGALRDVWQRPPEFVRSGGTIPGVAALAARGIQPVLVGFGLPADAIHGAQESLHLPTFSRAVDALQRFLVRYGGSS
jgi:acetylornithine deacetylase/succinyl-diaminopimelate desuccinylase-like protein